jgi:long-chain fatty acid transport protein
MKRLSTAVLAALALAALRTTAGAGGLIVPGYGSQGQPRAGAMVAKADDASAMYYNPAGLAKQRGTSLHLGFNFLDFDQTFQRSGQYEPVATGEDPPWVGQPYEEVSDHSSPAVGFGGFQGIPTFGLVTDLGGRLPLVVAVGLIAEHTFPEREYAEGYDFEDPAVPPPPQRYDIIEQDVSAAFPSLAAGYRLSPQLDVGARVSWGFGGSKGTQYLWGLRNYEEDEAVDGRFSVDLKDNFIFAASAGVMFRPTGSIELGASYQLPRELNFKGDGLGVLGSKLGIGETQEFLVPETEAPACAPGGTAAALKSCVNLTLPQTASAGGRYILRDGAGGERGDIELDVVWEDWSAASDVEVVVDGKSGLTGLRLQPAFIRHGFEDTFSFRLGGSYGFDVGAHRLVARAGAAYDTAAASNSWTRLDLDGFARTTLGAGLAYQMDSLRLEAGGGVVLEGSRDVPDDCNPTTMNPGCSGTGADAPVAERERPDPAQPLLPANSQVESPFNAGHYEQGYLLLSAGVTYLF